jgi:hypothetical protein
MKHDSFHSVGLEKVPGDLLYHLRVIFFTRETIQIGRVALLRKMAA